MVDTRIFVKDGGTSGSDDVRLYDGGQFGNFVSPKNLDFNNMGCTGSGSDAMPKSSPVGDFLPNWTQQGTLIDDVAIIGTANVDDDVEGEFLTKRAGATPAKVAEG